MKRIIKTRRTLCMALPLLLLPLCAGLCGKDPAACHKILTVVNQSDSTISFRTLSSYPKEGKRYVSLGGCFYQYPVDLQPNDTLVFENLSRYCIEEELFRYSLYVVPKATPDILTTMDSLEMVYDILKIIDLAEMGVDSLRKTNFTVYYP